MELDTIVCGDCLDVMADMPNKSIDLSILDPPYCAQNKARTGTRYNQEDGFLTKFDDMSQRVYQKFMHERLLILFDKMKPASHIYVFIGWKNLREMMDILELASFRLNKVLIWDFCSIGGGYAWRNQHEFIVFGSKGIAHPVNDLSLSTVLKYKRNSKRLHPFEKPIDLIKTIIENTSAPSELVTDFFIGSGTTAEAALRLGRHFYGCDISEKYVGIANKRIEKARLEMAQTKMF